MTTTAPTQVKVGDLTDSQLATMHQFFVNSGETENQATVDAEINRRIGAQTSELAKLRSWATAQAAGTPKAPQVSPEAPAPPSDGQVPEAPPSVKDRPKALDQLVGQEQLVMQLKMTITGAKLRGVPMAHCLLVGPSGCGKTTISRIIAEELGYKMVEANSMMLKKAADLVGLAVKTAGTPTVLYIDEVHCLPTVVQESLYSIMEEAKVDILVGAGMDAEAFEKELPDLLICASTTRPGVLAEPFKQRFGFIGSVVGYDEEQLAEIVRRSWDRVGFTYGENEPAAVAHRCQGVPRKALKLGERVLDYALIVNQEKNVSDGMAGNALNVFGIDHHGLEENDYAILECLVRRHGGQSVGLDTIATETGLDAKSIAQDQEPYLLRTHVIARSKGGRIALPKAFALIEEREQAS